MTEYQDSRNMLSIDEIFEIESLMAEKQFNAIANKLLQDPKMCLYVTEGSTFPDYVSSFQLDTIRTAFAERLLMIASRAFNKSTYCIKTYIEKDKGSNLWHKVWEIDIR
jgi:hypothetical protein